MQRHVNLILELGKIRIAVLATLSMIAGYILAKGGVSLALLPLTFGLFLLACGSAALNQIQDRDIDARMVRTQGRALPSGRASLRYAWLVTTSFIGIGSLLLLVVANATAMVLGLVAVFWYNAVYTPLKRMTAFAAVPGGVVGALPPVIGWVAGGGSALDPQILAGAFFFFVWQIPHFWLLLLFSCGKDYERAGLPSLTRLFNTEQIARITYMWILGTVMAGIAIPLFGVVDTVWVTVGLQIAGLWLVWRSTAILGAPDGMMSFRLAFRQINVYVLLIISLLAVNGIFG